MWPLFGFFLGVVILLFSTNLLIKLATRLAFSLRFSPLIVGITVIAIGTSLPELAVSTIASFRGDFGLAIGNIIGSNIINIVLVLALGILAGNLKVGTTKTQRNIMFLALISVMYVIFYVLHLSPLFITGASLSLCVLFIIMEYQWGVAGRKLEDKVMLKITKKTKLSAMEYVEFSLSFGLIFLGGYLVVNSVKKIALLTGLSTTVLGLSVTAIATSLPEIMTTIFSGRQRQGKLLLGNIIGSNIYNLLLIGGITSFWMQEYRLPLLDISFFLVATFIFILIIVGFKGKIIPSWVGLCLLAVCTVYFLSLYYFK